MIRNVLTWLMQICLHMFATLSPLVLHGIILIPFDRMTLQMDKGQRCLPVGLWSGHAHLLLMASTSWWPQEPLSLASRHLQDLCSDTRRVWYLDFQLRNIPLAVQRSKPEVFRAALAFPPQAFSPTSFPLQSAPVHLLLADAILFLNPGPFLL